MDLSLIHIFGVDSRSDQLDKGTRSDSIMVVRVDHDAKKIRMVSIFSDCMMNIDGHGYQKVTHAHAFGGPELAVDTPVSYTHLDVYKRQAQHNCKMATEGRFEEIDIDKAILDKLSLIHI